MSVGSVRHDDEIGHPQIIRHGFSIDAQAAARGNELDRAALLRNGIFGFETADHRNRPFAMLRSQILRRLERIDGHILAVTSTQPGAGKSFVAANLAAAMSQIRSCWLVDLDLRRPCVGSRFGLPPGDGVDDYLLGSVRLGARDCRMGMERITILPVSQPRANSAEILSSERTADLFGTMRSPAEPPICIIDTPPVLQGDDMMILAGRVDAILLVVEEGQTRRSDLSDSLRMLQPTPIIGSILNKTIFAKSSSYQYQKYAR